MAFFHFHQRHRTCRRAPEIEGCSACRVEPLLRIMARSTTFRSSPDVTRPGIALHLFHGLCGDRIDGFAHSGAEFLDEGPDQERDVLGPLTERRKRDRGRRSKAVVEVFSRNSPSRIAVEQVAIGCRHDPHVDTRSSRSSPTVRTVHPGELCSSLACSSIDKSPISSRKSVESWAISKRPICLREGSRVGPGLATEEFTFHQRTRAGPRS